MVMVILGTSVRSWSATSSRISASMKQFPRFCTSRVTFVSTRSCSGEVQARRISNCSGFGSPAKSQNQKKRGPPPPEKLGKKKRETEPPRPKQTKPKKKKKK